MLPISYHLYTLTLFHFQKVINNDVLLLQVSVKVAHRSAIFLSSSWDVEIDDSLVGQLTISESGVGSNKAGES